MLHILKRAVTPPLSLRGCLNDWADISYRLREPPRRRTPRIEQIEEQIGLLS